MSANATNFSNPDHLPVEAVFISVKNNGVFQKIAALDPHWIEKHELIIYEHPPHGSDAVIGATDAWINKMEVYAENLRWLLALEHHRFWSMMLYSEQCMDVLVSFLQEANPPYMPIYSNKKVQKLYEDIRKLVLVIFSRLITNKESDLKWMTKEYLSDVIYNKFIFTVPILWDICLVYGSDNSQHVSKLVTSVFKLQPKYLADLEAAVAFVKEAFKYIILQVNKDFDSTEPPNLPETFKGFSEIRRPPTNSNKEEKLTFNMLRDLVIHLLDTALTMRIFVEAYPKCVNVLKKQGFVLSIVQLYEYAIPQLYEKLSEVGDETSVSYTAVHGYIDLTREELVDVFREILAVSKNAIFSGQDSIETHVEEYLSTILEGLSEKLLIKDYHACYPVHEDLEMLKQAYPKIDPVKTDFILQAIYSNLDEPLPENLNKTSNCHIETTDYNQTANSTVQPTDNEIPDNVKQESLISEVKDIFPDLGDGFILKCLQHYGFRSDRVINCILEDNLDSSLKSLDRSLPIIPEDPLDNKFLETGIERLNVFDGDEFDIMTRDDVDLSRIHVGKKKSKYKDLKDMLNDKSEVKKMGDYYNKFSLVCDEAAMYSDEYDDTYDDEGGAPPVGDSTADDDRRPLVTPRVLQHTLETKSESEDSEEEPSPAPSGSGRDRMNFCVNPEEIRAKREAQRRHGRPGRPAPPTKSADVIGRARGQGQDKEVIVNREKKEKHKSSRANHNRRAGASWKRSQGMMPS